MEIPVALVCVMCSDMVLVSQVGLICLIIYGMEVQTTFPLADS